MKNIFDSLLNNKIFFIFFLCLIIYNINFHPIPSYDTIPARLLPWNILESHNLYLDSFADAPFVSMPSFALEEHGHYVSIFPIVLPVLITPLYIIPYFILKIVNIPISLGNPAFVIISLIVEKVSASVITSLSVVVLYLVLKKLISVRNALFCSLVYAFATCTWVISSQALWQHGLGELLLCLILLILLMITEKESISLYALLGVLVALFALNRPPDFVFLIPVFIFAALTKNIRKIFVFITALLISASPFVLYNIINFGSLFGGYKINTVLLQVGTGNLVPFIGLLLSPNRGMFVFSPILLFSVLGCWLIFKNKISLEPKIRTLFLLFALCVPLNIFVYSSFSYWWGGEQFGYRFLVGSLPVFALFLGFAIEYLWAIKSSRSSPARILFTVFLVWSIFVQVCGAFYYYYDWDMKSGTYESINDNQARVWDYSDLQIFRGFSIEPNPVRLLIMKIHQNRGASLNVTSSL